MGLRTLIVESEPIARRLLREELQQLAEADVVGECADGPTALAAIRDLTPELVLLDLRMPGMSGFDVMKELPPEGWIPMIVIMTPSESDAIPAFEAGAIDYLLKPVNRDRLVHAVERALRLRKRAAGSSSVQPARRIVARSGGEYLLLNPEEVYAFQAEGDLVWIITAKKRYLATQSLKLIQEKLRDTSFRRIHRKALVNIDHVRKMSTLSSQRWLLTLSNNQEFIVSKRQARNVRQLLTR